MLIFYIPVAQDGLGLMYPFTRAVPDLILTMIHAMQYGEYSFAFHKNVPTYMLPPSLAIYSGALLIPRLPSFILFTTLH